MCSWTVQCSTSTPSSTGSSPKWRSESNAAPPRIAKAASGSETSTTWKTNLNSLATSCVICHFPRLSRRIQAGVAAADLPDSRGTPGKIPGDPGQPNAASWKDTVDTSPTTFAVFNTSDDALDLLVDYLTSVN